MHKPLFSIVIPTRQRHQTLGAAIRSVLFQPYDDYELIVMDNASSAETAEVVRLYPSPKLRYDRAPEVLPMNDNWERGLAQCRGEYVFFMGDDDALMPDGLVLASQILARAELDVLMWQKFTYWWENAISELLRGRLFVHFTNGYTPIDGHAMLAGYYDWSVGFGALPSIYSGFVRRSLIDTIRAKTGGKYFAAGSPDVYGGVANAYFGKSLGFFQRGLSISGNSGASTGCSHFFRSKGEARRKTYYTEERKTVGELLHSSLIPTVNLEMNLADAQIRAKELLFPEDARYRFNPQRTLMAMAAGINRDPGSYDETLADIHAFAKKFSLDVTQLAIPTRAPEPTQFAQGLMQEGNGSAPTLAVNCAAAGVRDCAEAARLAHSLLPAISIN